VGQATVTSAPIDHLHDDSELGHAIQGKYLSIEALTKEGIQIVQIGLHVHVAIPVLGDVERWAEDVVVSAEEVR
jgi:hypothetical protein